MQLIWARESRLFKEAFFQSLIYLLAGLLALWLPAVLWLQTSRYGWKPAADDRKLISVLSALTRQPGIPHLNTTNRIQPRLAQAVPPRLALSAMTDWSLTYGLCDRHHFCQIIACQRLRHPLSERLRFSLSGSGEIKLMIDCSQAADSHFVSLSVGSWPFSKHPNSNLQTVLGLEMTPLLIDCPLCKA